MLSLHPVSERDVVALRRFETDNRAFFESHINARPPTYYDAGGIEAAVATALREAAADIGHQYLIRDADGELVGRINLSHVRRRHFHSCELGYRIAERANGRGHAKEAVKLVLAKAFDELGLVRIEAKARAGNLGSLKVLRHNGFTEFGRSMRSFQLHDEWEDMLHFERRAPGR